MHSFSKRSAANLETCDHRLIALAERVIQICDCAVLCGHRSQEKQDEALAQGLSQTPWPNSRHNFYPSRAVDLVKSPIDWSDRDGHYYFAGIVIGVAATMGIRIRWGGDWNMDNDLRESFMDLVHFELID